MSDKLSFSIYNKDVKDNHCLCSSTDREVACERFIELILDLGQELKLSRFNFELEIRPCEYEQFEHSCQVETFQNNDLGSVLLFQGYCDIHQLSNLSELVADIIFELQTNKNDGSRSDDINKLKDRVSLLYLKRLQHKNNTK